MLLGGRLDHTSAGRGVAPSPGTGVHARPMLAGGLAAALLIAGFGFLNLAEAGWAHPIGAACLLGFVATGLPAAASLEGHGREDTPSIRPTTDPRPSRGR